MIEQRPDAEEGAVRQARVSHGIFCVVQARTVVGREERRDGEREGRGEDGLREKVVGVVL